MTVTCGICENEIHPGNRRDIYQNETVHHWCLLRERARQSYSFYIQNPADRPNVGYALWYRDGDEEYPFLSNTGGLTTWSSRHTSVGDAIEVKPEFIMAFGYGWHWFQCYRPMTDDQVESTLEDVDEMYYAGEMGSHERWALNNLLLGALFADGPLPPEWKPLIDFADSCTQFGVPEVIDA